MNKLQNKIIVSILVSIFLLSVVQNCTKRRVTEEEDLADLFWAAEKIDILDVMDLDSSSSDTSKPSRFFLGENNKISFKIPRPGIYFIRFWKAEENSFAQGNEDISLFINDKKITNVDFLENEFFDFYISWSVLQKGSNLLHFTSNQGHAIISPKKIVNSIELGFVINSLAKYLEKENFQKFAMIDDGKGKASPRVMAQKRDSYFNYYVKAAPGMSLKLGYQLINFDSRYDPSSLGISVDLIGQEKQYQSLLRVGSPESSLRFISLKSYKDQVVKLSFRFVPDKRNIGSMTQVRWIDPVLVTPRIKKESTKARDIKIPKVSPSQKNVIWIVLDALNARHVSCYGYPYQTTPHIDAISLEAIQFNQAYTQGVNTNIALASMFTSLYPETTRVWGYKSQLIEKAETIAEILNEKGMQTLVISDHQGLDMSNLTQGFQDRIIIEGNILMSRPAFFKKTLDYLKNLKPSKNGNFIYMHFLYPHSPFHPPEPFRSKFDKDYEGTIDGTQKTLLDSNRGKLKVTERDIIHLRSLYDGNLNYIDHILGQIFKELKHNGLYQDSLIIITADHGEGLMEHGYFFHNQYVYEESIHVPLILKFPHSFPSSPGKIETAVELIDLFPTILDYLGVDYDRDKIHGKSLIPLIKSKSGYSKPLIYSRGHGKFFSFSARYGHYKYIYHAPTKSDELYDIRLDPDEKNNLFLARPNQAGYFKMNTLDWIIRQWNTEQNLASPKKYSKKELERLKALGYLK